MKNMTNRKYQPETACDGEREGFTLDELMLVVVILGILASVVVVGFTGHTKKASIAATRTSIGNIGVAIDAYEIEAGRFPTDLKQLTLATQDRGPLIQSANISDSWGTEFQYNPNKGSFQYEIRSAGPDMQFGTEDDITN